MDSSCTITIEESLCTSTLSRLNIANYLQKRTGNTNPFSPLQPVIDIETGLDRLATVHTVFRCSSDLSTDPNSLDICSWDDDQTYPPSPKFVNGVCEDSTIDVYYNIEYNNTNIVKITATYIMADVPLETVSTRTFTRSWFEDVIIPSNVTSNSSSNATAAPQTEPQLMTELFTVTDSHPMVITTRYRVGFSQTGGSNSITYSGKPG